MADTEAHKQQFFALIGEITLAHAAIEQEVKNYLLFDWKIPEKLKIADKDVSLETLHGWKLGHNFLGIMKECKLPQRFLEKYEQLFKHFDTLSKERNATLKALYSFDKNNGQAIRINMKQFHSKPKINSTEDFEAHVNLWLQKTDQEGLHDLKKELHAVRQSFEMLKWEVWKDKQAKFDSFNIGIGVTFPEHAMVQPYLFEQTLKEQSTTRGQQAIK